MTVDDGVNPPVVGTFTVEVGDGPPGEDAWDVVTTEDPPSEYVVTIEDHAGSLVVTMDDGVDTSLAYGVEFPGVIFWMELWMDISDNIAWGVGDMFFGNIDRSAGTMSGVMFEEEGGIFEFSGTARD